MYKKITHTIVEEHFEGTDEKLAMRLRQPMMTEQELRDFVTGYFNTFNDKMNTLVSAVSSPFDTTDIETEIFAMIDDFGNHSKQFYGFDFGESFNALIRSAAITYFNAVMQGMQRMDTLFSRNRINQISNDMTSLVTNYNNRWLFSDIQPTIRSWLLGYIDQIDALIQKNTSAAESAKNATTEAINTFTNAYVTGTVDKYPNMFV